MRKFALITALLFVPSLALAQNISNSPHDLSFASTASIHATASNDVTVQLCVPCHVPHNATATRLLWSRTLDNTVLGWSDETATVNGTTLGGTPGEITTRCLSCHDGTVALGDLTPSGNNNNPVTVLAGRTTAAFLMDPANDARFVRAAMDGNHPVSIPYAGETYNSVTSGAVVTAGAYNSAAGLAIGVLYNDGTGDGIECGSCHDPHQYGLAADTQPFLRGSKVGSVICLDCHDK